MKSSFQTKRDFIKNIVIFQGFRSKSFYYLANQSEEKTAARNEVIIEQGTKFTGLIIIMSGRLRLSKVISRHHPESMVRLNPNQGVNPETQVEIELAQILPEYVCGWLERDEFRFRVSNGNNKMQYLLIPQIALKDILDTNEISKLKTFFVDRSTEHSYFLHRNIFFRDLLEKQTQPTLAIQQVNFCRKPIPFQYFRLKSKSELPRIGNHKNQLKMHVHSKLDLLPLDFMGTNKVIAHSKKRVKMDGINVTIIKKSIEKLKLVAINPVFMAKSPTIKIMAI